MFTEAAITIGIIVLVLLFHRQILGLFVGQIEADVMQNAIIYLIISVFSFPLLAVYDSCAALYLSLIHILGQGIAKAFAQVDGYEVALCDIKQEWADGGKEKIKKGYARCV